MRSETSKLVAELGVAGELRQGREGLVFHNQAELAKATDIVSKRISDLIGVGLSEDDACAQVEAELSRHYFGKSKDHSKDQSKDRSTKSKDR